MKVYDETVKIRIIRSGTKMCVSFYELHDGDVIDDSNHKGVIVDGDAHISGDADYEGWLFYDRSGESYFPEDFGAEAKYEKPKKDSKIKVIMLEPGKLARVEVIDNSLESMQTIVGGLIQAVYPSEDRICVVCNEEGLLLNLEPNRALRADNGKVYGVLVGTAFICSFDEANFASLTDEQIERFTKLYQIPERPVLVNGSRYMVPNLKGE